MRIVKNFVEDLIFAGDTLSYWRAEHFGLVGEPFQAKSSGGRVLSGVVLSRPKVALRGWVLHFRAGGRNLGFHMPQVAHLAQIGFRVAMFDYAGSGSSTGRSTFEGLLADGEALYGVLRALGAEKIFLFGQGVGADAALQLLAAHQEAFAGIALESAWASHSGWVRERWGPLIGDIAAKALREAALEPAEILHSVRKPVLLIEPAKDDFVRKRERCALERVMPQKTEVWKVNGIRHLGVFGAQGEAQESRNKRLVEFIEKSLR